MSMITKAVLADIVGITAVALASGAVAAALYRSQAISQPWLVWLIALPFLVGASLWVWHISEKTRNWKSNRWGYALLFTPLVGAISFAIDVLIGGSDGRYKTFLEAASHAGSPFGFPLTVLICPVGTFIAFGIWIRCVICMCLKTKCESILDSRLTRQNHILEITSGSPVTQAQAACR